ncbi:hypothetical protein [Paracoccus ravus]|uniref:hypothetical protein n=1 Tax=Paracoccus ravus TaxID=2447760 RepID=UPI00106E02F8|nr:hypothetical protein [Paracoccus ravus]
MIDIIDICLGLALLAVLAHNLRLSRKIDKLMAALRDTAPAFKEFSQAVDRSQQSVAMLRQAVRTESLAALETSARQPKRLSLTQQFYAIARRGNRS